MTSLTIAIGLVAALAGACIAINWLLYTDFASRRAAREAYETKFRADCSDLIMKRRTNPDDQQVKLDIAKCETTRSRLSR